MTNKKDILGCVLPRIIQPSSIDSGQLGLEITDGPYKGVTFGYKTFNAVGEQKDGMVPIKYETIIYSAPSDFQQDESFDTFTRDFLVAWLELIAEMGAKP